MDTFGGPPTDGEFKFFIAFCAVIIFGIGFIAGMVSSVYFF